MRLELQSGVNCCCAARSRPTTPRHSPTQSSGSATMTVRSLTAPPEYHRIARRRPAAANPIYSRVTARWLYPAMTSRLRSRGGTGGRRSRFAIPPVPHLLDACLLNPRGAELGRDHGNAGEPRMHWPPGGFGHEATGLILRRMPTSTHPMAPRLHRERIVQVQRMHGGATTSRHANDVRAILAPLEVIAPSLEARIE